MNKKIIAYVALMAWCVLPLSAATDKKLSADECTQDALLSELTTGIVAGAASCAAVNGLRAHVLPDLSSLKLHDNYGICRDQLAGEAKTGIALLGMQAIKPSTCASLKKLSARIIGIVAGITVAEVIKKQLS